MNRIFKLSGIVLLMFTSIGFSADTPKTVPNTTDFVVPKQTIVGLDKPVAIGDAIKLSLSKAEIVAPLSSIDEEWRIFEFTADGNKSKLAEKPVDVYDTKNGKVVVFGSGASNRTVFVEAVVTYLFIVKDTDKIGKIATKTVIITGELTIGDGTDPQPPPKPDVIPDGKFGLTKLVFESVNSNVKEGKVLASKATSKAYDSVVLKIKAGTLVKPEDILSETNKVVTMALSMLTFDKSGWSKTSDAIQNSLFDLYEMGQLKSADDYVEALSSLSDGLKLIK